MTDKSIKQKSNYIHKALKNGTDLSSYIPRLTSDELDIVVANNPKVLKYLNSSHLKQIKIAIANSRSSYRYLKDVPDEVIIQLIEFRSGIIRYIDPMTMKIMEYIAENNSMFAIICNFPKKLKRIAIQNLIDEVFYADYDSWVECSFWTGYINYYTDYDKFYICTILNKTEILKSFEQIKEIIESCSHIMVPSILTDGPANEMAGGFDFDIEFRYLN